MCQIGDNYHRHRESDHIHRDPAKKHVVVASPLVHEKNASLCLELAITRHSAVARKGENASAKCSLYVKRA